MPKPRHAWMVRAGDDNFLADLIEAAGAIAIGWYLMGDLTALKTRDDFKKRYPAGRALGRDYALAELRLVFHVQDEPEEKARLALLSEIFTRVPLTARAHRELNSLRHSRVAGQALVAQLLRIVRDYDLEEAYRIITDRADEAPLIPRIICSEALLG